MVEEESSWASVQDLSSAFMRSH